MNYLNILGSYSDSVFQSLGVNHRLFKYGGIIITPNPFSSHLGAQPLGEVTFQLSDVETRDTYILELPRVETQSLLGEAKLKRAIATDATWEISNDSGTTWRLYHVAVTTTADPVRYKLRLIAVVDD